MQKLNEYLCSVKNFNGCVLVAQGGEIILEEGYGFADKTEGKRNAPGTSFYIGSITKSMTALSILQLVENGSLQLGARIEEFLPGIYDGKRITLHHLLCHTSGIPNDFSFEEIRTGENLTSMEIIEFVSKKPLKYEPGRKWTYSNSNFMLLAFIIEKVSGETYHEYVKKSVLQPAGMKKTSFSDKDFKDLAQPGKSMFHCTPNMMLGAGDVISDIEDLYRYDQALYTETLATKQSIDTMQHVAHNGTFVKYGYGWFINKNFGHRSVSHGGLHPLGYTSHLERYPEDGLTIIVLSNAMERYSPLGSPYFGSTDIARELAARFFDRKARFWQKLF